MFDAITIVSEALATGTIHPEDYHCAGCASQEVHLAILYTAPVIREQVKETPGPGSFSLAKLVGSTPPKPALPKRRGENGFGTGGTSY